MTTTRRAQLREIMQMAWSWFRQVGGEFADALRLAWRKSKADAASRIQVRHRKPMLSPASRRLSSGPYSRTRDFREGGMIARAGY